MLFKDLLPGTYSLSTDPTNSVWNGEFNFESPQLAEVLINLFETELEGADGELKVILGISTAFESDVLKLTSGYQEKSRRFRLIQFCSCALLIAYLASNKLFPYCFDWICNSLDEEITNEKVREIQLGRLDDVMGTKDLNDFWSFLSCLPLWTYGLFYYSRNTGGHIPLCTDFVDTHFAKFNQMALATKNLDFTRALVQISTWCGNNQKFDIEKACSNSLYTILTSTDEFEIRKEITFFFSLQNRVYTDENKEFWIEKLTKDFSSSFDFHEKFQLLVNQCEQDIGRLIENLEQIICEIRIYKSLPIYGDKKLYSYHDSQIFQLLSFSIHTLAINGYIKEANSIFGAYFDIEDHRLIQAKNCYIIPNSSFGIHFCFDSHVETMEKDVKTILPAMTSAGNDFLSVNSTFNNHPDFELKKYARFGHPNHLLANKFCESLVSYFSLEVSSRKENFLNCNGYYLLFGNQLPIQTVMTRQLGMTIPIVHSFQEPEEARKLKKVFIWQGHANLAENERLALQNIFEKQQISVDYLVSETASKEEFLKHYYSDDYDAIWITGHGQFDYFESHESYLDLGNGIEIRIGEIEPYRTDQPTRRLLFLNACDGATSVFHNSPVAIGIGNSLISKNQSLLSHSWPVENVPCLIFSLLIAINLIKEPDYCLAHQRSIEKFLQGKDEVLNFLGGYYDNGEAVDRISNKEFDYQNFYYWGSLTYLI